MKYTRVASEPRVFELCAARRASTDSEGRRRPAARGVTRPPHAQAFLRAHQTDDDKSKYLTTTHKPDGSAAQST